MNQETKKTDVVLDVVLDVPTLQRMVTELVTNLLTTTKMFSHLVPPESEEARLGVSQRISLALMMLRFQLDLNKSTIEDVALACNNAELNEIIQRMHNAEQEAKNHGRR